MMSTSVVVPTLNPGPLWETFSTALLANLRRCKLKPARVLVLDSASTDQTPEKAKRAGFRVRTIARGDFDHGGTRQLSVLEESDAEFLVFLTQDAILASEDALAHLLAAFSNPLVGAAYGRQLPRQGAGRLEAHARLFNYPETSKIRSFQDRDTMGIKSAFASNSFCAYRRTALLDVGGFPSPTICSEELIAISRMHMVGWRSTYVAEARVYHSHAFTIPEESRRYFDIGVTHARNPFLLEVFGTPSGEGKRFVISELRYLLRTSPQQIPAALMRTLAKLVAYQLGRRENMLSLRTRWRLSMNRGFWAAERGAATGPEFSLQEGDYLDGPPPAPAPLPALRTAARPFREPLPESLHLPRAESASRLSGFQQGI